MNDRIKQFFGTALNLPFADKAYEASAFSISAARSFLHFAQSLPLFAQKRIIREIAGLKNSEATEVRKPSLHKLIELLREDAKNIVDGYYPPDVLLPEMGPLDLTKSWFRVMWDGLGLSLREVQQKKTFFDDEAKKLLEELPEYYRRNFHFQTNGYLSRKSAELYDHQVNLLFLGATDAMRRMMIPILMRYISKADELQALEIGVGTGSSTKQMLTSFENISLTGIDPSRPYLGYARERLSKFDNLTLKQGIGESLEFADESQDFVYCVYVFHEVPMPIRKKIISEVKRVLKPGGIFLLVDSIQKGDDEDFDWMLELFPKNFHEPFYKNYIENNSSQLFLEGWEILESKVGFTTKVLCVGKK